MKNSPNGPETFMRSRIILKKAWRRGSPVHCVCKGLFGHENSLKASEGLLADRGLHPLGQTLTQTSPFINVEARMRFFYSWPGLKWATRCRTLEGTNEVAFDTP